MVLPTPTAERRLPEKAPEHDPDRQPDQDQFGGTRFVAASSTVRKLRPDSTAAPERGLGREDISGVLALGTLLRRLPRVEVRLSDSPGGHVIERHLRERRWGIAKNRIAQAYLPLPGEVDQYQSGRRWRMHRRNVRKAEGMGMSVVELGTREERESTAAHFFNEGYHGVTKWGRPERWVSALEHTGDVWWAALDGADNPRAVIGLSLDVEWAMINFFIGLSHRARWLLHTRLVEALIGAGISYVCLDAPNALLEHPGAQYFQRQAGYQVAHLHLAASGRLGAGERVPVLTPPRGGAPG